MEPADLRRPLARILTLDEAAAALTQRTGQRWTIWDIVAAAERGEVSVMAPWTRAVTLVRYAPREGQQNELTTVIDCWCPIPVEAALSLVVTRAHAVLDAIPGFVESSFERDDTGLPKLVPGNEWVLTPGETGAPFVIEQCRVYNHAVDQLIDRYGGDSETPAGAAGAATREIPAERRRRRLSRFRELGGEMRQAGESWHSNGGRRGALADLVREETEAGRPMADNSDVRADLNTAMGE